MFQTSDLYLACALKTALHLPFPEIHLNDRFSTFCFQVHHAEAQQAADAFYNGLLRIDAREFALTLRDLKALLCQQRQAVRR